MCVRESACRYMCACMTVCVCMCLRMCLCVCVYMYVCACVHIFVCAHIDVGTKANFCICMSVQSYMTHVIDVRVRYVYLQY